MSRFLATQLDLSRLPAPVVVKDLSYDEIKAARIADLIGRMTAAGIEYDVGGLESDPAIILQEADAYRELLDLGAINDAAKAVMLPHATGTDLDNLGAFFGCARLTGELDEPYRARVQLAPEAYATAGSIGAYVYQARAVDAAVRDVGVTCPSPGVARVVVLGSATGEATPPDLVATVRARLMRDDVRPLTDEITVLGAEITPYAIRLRLVIPSGPDPALVREAALAGLARLAADSYRVGAGVSVSAIVGAAWTPNVRRVIVEAPLADIAASPLAAPWCTAIDIATEVGDG